MVRASFTSFHVAPASSELKRPPFSFSTSVYTRFESAPDTDTPIFPTTPAGKPALRVISFHVSPPSVDLNTPSPGWMLARMHDSPMPMKRMSGFDADTASAPTDELAIWPSVTGAQVSPPSVVFQRPPPTAPKYASLGRPLTP